MPEGSGEGDGGEKDFRAPVVARCDASPVFQAPEHDLDPVSPFVAALVVLDGFVTGAPAGDAGLDALVSQGLPEPVRVIAAIAEQPLRLGQVVQQRCRARVVADLPGGHEEAQWAAVRVGDSMELGVHAAFGAADQAPEIPFFNRRLDAVRCAFR